MLKEYYETQDTVHVDLICDGKEELKNGAVSWEDFQDANQKILEKVETGNFKSFSIKYHGKNMFTVTVATKEEFI